MPKKSRRCLRTKVKIKYFRFNKTYRIAKKFVLLQDTHPKQDNHKREKVNLFNRFIMRIKGVMYTEELL